MDYAWLPGGIVPHLTFISCDGKLFGSRLKVDKHHIKRKICG